MMYRKESPLTIQAMFNDIAGRYDKTNAVLSFSLHRTWNRALIQQIFKRQGSPQKLVDLCSGTGDIAFEFLKKSTIPCEATLIDFAPEMLAYAKQKANQMAFPAKHQLQYVEADVMQIALPDDFADCATMAYGIRNVLKPAICIEHAFRILKPGGTFGILELTRPQSSFLRLGHKVYLNTLIPLLGKWLTKNQGAYHYLCRSIENFIEPTEIEKLFNQQGFLQTECLALAGGIATIIIGTKPS